MAKVTFLNAIIAGRVDGQVYSRNRFGYYVRRFANPVQPRTVSQVNNRHLMNTVAAQWSSLTLPQLQAWAAFAQVNPYSGKLYLTAQQFFTAVNRYRLECGKSMTSDPPGVWLSVAGTLVNVTVVYVPAVPGPPPVPAQLNVTGLTSTPDQYLRTSANRGWPKSRIYTSTLPLLTYANMNTVPPAGIDIMPAFIAKFGAAPVSQSTVTWQLMTLATKFNLTDTGNPLNYLKGTTIIP